MPHVSFGERRFEDDVDYVVVGSGAGGAAAAVVLARAGAKVALVEAGAWREPEHYPSSAYGAMRDLMDDWGASVTLGRALWPVVQARTMGGTTVVNSAIAIRTPADLFSQWEREHGVGGDGLRERVWAAQEVLERELCVEEVPPASRGRSNELAMKGAEAMGMESHWIRRYAKGCAGTGQCLQGCRKQKKQSTNVVWVPEVLARGGLVLSCAPVTRVVLEGTRAVGVEGRFVHPATREQGASFLVRARKAVVVAASVTHSPVLLMRSGVKRRALGRFFRAHPGTGVFGVYDAPVDQNVGATQGWASTQYRERPGLKLETLSIPLELVASRFAGGGTELMKRLGQYRHVAMWCHAVRAESTGTVSPGPFGGAPVVRYTLDADDMERFREGLHLLAKMHFAAGARAVIPGVAGLPFELGQKDVDRLREGPTDPRHYIAVLTHLFGGCVMGADPDRSVVDGEGRVHGYQGLVVADASVIPTNLGVNPQHTIMALARLNAEALLARA
ncbi:MAG: GMC family oxidoreductase [Myxococcaceae bacterium]|jgi:choline dehydrogenase-like flavoprotein|nr:GMC family oxidoreductase [Myxococcaceae bacterium]